MTPPPYPSNMPLQATQQPQFQPALFGQPQTYQPLQTVALIQYQPQNAPLAYSVAEPVQPIAQQIVAPQPILAQSYAPQPVVAQSVQQSVHPTIKGESRIEYIPYQKAITEYEEQEVVQYIPRERKVTEYYTVEYQTEYIPQVFQEKYTEYLPVDRYQERVEYYPVERQVVHQQVAQQPVQGAQQTVQVVQQPVQVYQQPVQTVPVAYAPQYAPPIISSRLIPGYQPQLYQSASQRALPEDLPRSIQNSNI